MYQRQCRLLNEVGDEEAPRFERKSDGLKVESKGSSTTEVVESKGAIGMRLNDREVDEVREGEDTVVA